MAKKKVKHYDHLLSVRLSEAEYHSFKQIKALTGKTLSQMVREAISFNSFTHIKDNNGANNSNDTLRA